MSGITPRRASSGSRSAAFASSAIERAWPREPPLNAVGIDVGDEREAFVHRDRERLRAAHPAEPGGHHETTSKRPAKVPARNFRQRFVRALQDALRADVNPASCRHLAVHRQPAILEVAEGFPRCPRGHQQRVGDEDARRPLVRAEDADGLSGLDEQRFVRVEAAQHGDDCVERRPRSRGAPGSAVDNQIVGPLGDGGVEVVHQHPQRRFLRPSLAGDGRAARCGDLAAENGHGRRAPGRSGARCVAAEPRTKVSNLRTYARVVKLKMKNFLLDF
jgi:hypothetical protein